MKLLQLFLISALQAISPISQAASPYFCINFDLVCSSGFKTRVTGIGPTKESAEINAENKFGKACPDGGRVEGRAPCKGSQSESFQFETNAEEE